MTIAKQFRFPTSEINEHGYVREGDRRRKSKSGLVDRSSATETVDLGSILVRVNPNNYKNWYSQLSCMTFSN